MIHLSRKNSNELDIYFPHVFESYSKELNISGQTADEVASNLKELQSSLFFEGKLREVHQIFNIMQDELNIGNIWLFAPQNSESNKWWIYDIEIFAEYMRRGFGREAMLAAEAYVLGKGGKGISLTVFGFNVKAKNLYDSLNYEVDQIIMKKTF